jgi:splicing factor 1
MPAGARKVPPEAPPPADVPEPPWYEATADIYYGDASSGAMPVLIHPAGDRVSPHAVERGGWGGMVKVPDRFAGQLPEPPPPPPEPPPPPSTEIVTGDGPAGKDN